MSGGLLDFLWEAIEIQQELGCSADESHEIRRRRAAEREREAEAAAVFDNVIPFRRKNADELA